MLFCPPSWGQEIPGFFLLDLLKPTENDLKTDYHRGQNYKKYFFKGIVLAQLILQKIQKQSLYTVNSFPCSLANRDKTVAATLQRKCSGGISFVIIRKTITKQCCEELFCNNFLEREELGP